MYVNEYYRKSPSLIYGSKLRPYCYVLFRKKKLVLFIAEEYYSTFIIQYNSDSCMNIVKVVKYAVYHQ